MKEVLIVASRGGHSYRAEKVYKKLSNNFNCNYISCSSKDYKLIPYDRNKVNMIRNFITSIHYFILNTPTHIISFGDGTTIPFILLGKILGIKTVYVESPCRVKTISYMGKVVLKYNLAKYVVCWDNKKGKFWGFLL